MEAVAVDVLKTPPSAEERAPESGPVPVLRSEKELIAATRAFLREDRKKSWQLLAITLLVQTSLLALAAFAPFWPLRLVAAILAGLTIVRLFIFYHDFQHNAILRGSKFAKVLFSLYGLYVMTPARAWRDSHNYHHQHTAKIVGSHVGSYMTVTTGMWKNMSRKERLMYKAVRHPLTIVFGYFTIFMLGMCVSPFLRNPKRHWDSALSLLLNWTISALLIYFAGFSMFFFAYFLPLAVAMMSGAYLFYAQHNFPDIVIQGRHEWSYSRAALESSSYMKMGPVMEWFTGNIGYHHVHHLNSMIPFYRLPEAMAAIPELQHPGTTTLSLKDIMACFRLKLWDPERGEMVGYPREGAA